MSVTTVSVRDLANKFINSSRVPNTITPWVRNPSWAALTSITAVDQKFVGLHAVYTDSNFLALLAATTGQSVTFQDAGDTVTLTAHGYVNGDTVSFSVITTTTGIVINTVYFVVGATANTFQVSLTSGGAAIALTTNGTGTVRATYTTDWGDGTTEVVASGVVAQHTYDYATVALDGTNAPVTLTDAGDLVTRTAHGYTDGMPVRFYNIVSTTGLTETYEYFVISATANTFQVSLTYNGSAVALTTDGTATLLFYKQAIVTVTPLSGRNLITLNLHQKNTQANLSTYASGFIDISVAGSLMTSLLIGVQTAGAATQTINFRDLEQVNILSTGIASASYLFYNCSSLESVAADTASVTNFSDMFDNCSSLQTIPLLNTAAGTTLAGMFYSCAFLTSIPLLNTATATDLDSMFSLCSSLQTIPLLNTALVTNFTSMFNTCASLTSIPLLNTSAGTNFTSMFSSCYSLTSIPLLNTAAGTNFTTMFYSCFSLTSIPFLNTALVTNFTSMFSTCSSLQTIPLLNTAAGTNFTSMFSTCPSLTSIPLLNTAAGTNFTTMFTLCSSLQTAALDRAGLGATGVTLAYTSCKFSQTGLEYIFSKLGRGTSSSLDIQLNWGTVTATTITLSKTTAGGLTAASVNTTGVTTGMQVTGTGTPSTTAIAVTMTDVGDTVNLTAHGLSNSDEVSFATVVTTTGILINTVYFVVGATANTFQVSLTAGGAAINLVTNGSGTLRYKATVTAITAAVNAAVPTVSVTFTDAGDLVTSVAHGFVNGDVVSFAFPIVSTTGISINTAYFVVGATANTFQVSLTSGGVAIVLTTNGSGTLARAVTFTDVGDTVNRVAHGYVNGDAVFFSSITTTTGISINIIYFVVGATANTFQVALTSVGAAIALTTNGRGSVASAGIFTLSRPATSTNSTGVTLSYRNLKTNTALLKGWSVTG